MRRSFVITATGASCRLRSPRISRQQEYEGIKDKLPPGMMVRPVYVRIYPNGKVAGQIIGYTGKTGRNPGRHCR